LSGSADQPFHSRRSSARLEKLPLNTAEREFAKSSSFSFSYYVLETSSIPFTRSIYYQ
jgi:hypothetical protein